MMLRYGKEYNKTIEGLKTEFTNKINEYIGTKLTRKDIVVKPNTKKMLYLIIIFIYLLLIQITLYLH